MNSHRLHGGRVWARFEIVLTLAVIVVLATSPFVLAQGGRASITGLVTDPSQSAIPGARVTITNTQTGLTKDATTTEIGTYVVPLLPPGTYSVTVERQGFKKQIRSGITLTVDQAATVNFDLEVGEVTEEVQVSGNAELVNTSTGALGQVVEERAILELPLNGRNPAALVTLSAGTVDLRVLGGQAGFNQQFLTFPTNTGASANGGQQGSTIYLLDNTYNMDTYVLLAAPFPNPDATREFRVLTNNYDAQYGFSASAVTSIVTKSGTNNWHGVAYEFLRNEKLNASNFFNRVRDGLKRNQFGGSIGGPIIRDKLFIFGNYQMTTERTVGLNRNVFVPTNAMYRGDFSSLLGLGRQLLDPATGLPFPNNQVDPARFSAPALKIAESLPRSDAPDGFLLLTGQPSVADYHEFTTRADYYIKQNHQVNFRTFLNDFKQPLYTGGGNLLNANRSWLARYQNHAGGYLWTVSPRTTNNLTIGYSRLYSDSEGGLRDKNGETICYSKVGVKVVDYPDAPCTINQLNLPGAFNIGQNYNYNRRWTMSVSNSVSLTRGKHLIVAGVDILKTTMDIGTDFAGSPLFTFNSSVTGHVFSDFLLGKPSEFWQGGGQFVRLKGTLWAGYVQDSIKLKPNLTVNLGMRWEPWLPPTPDHGRMPVFRPGQQSTRFPKAPAGLVFVGDPGVPAGGMDSQYSSFNPRVGIAWQPKWLPNTSIRAAGGFFSGYVDYAAWNSAAASAPFSPQYRFTRSEVGDMDFVDPWRTYAPTGGISPFPKEFFPPDSVPPSDTLITRPATIGHSFERNFKLARNQTWNLSIEHQLKQNWLVRAAYVGAFATHLNVTIERNPGIFAAGGRRTTYTDFQSILDYASVGTSPYHGGQFTLEKRFSNGLQFQANYTFSKVQDIQARGSFRNSPNDPFNLRSSYALSELHLPHVFVSNWVYQTPKLSSYSPVVRGVLGNWQLTGIWRLQSGRGFNINGGLGNDRSLAHIGLGDRADFTGAPLNKRQGSKSDWILSYFNKQAFQPNAPGTFGNTPRNVMQRPGMNTADLGFSKSFPFRESYRLQFRWEMFNAFNRPHFGTPVTNPSDVNFSRILGIGDVQPRVMQAALKFYW